MDQPDPVIERLDRIANLLELLLLALTQGDESEDPPAKTLDGEPAGDARDQSAEL